ncbi:dihydrodipicolinate synthase family protein [Adhaeribacter rhizoryzae]|uniref:Dihydrodipicolinate synthase family protein n=1 Tax=Adhaeribacter rhizoryzae TaxID=2607907 RepID=A0A5M6D066_9BACT|nr:dihydrodipicolinate synthase family protein [Adhaeribacter rhizoryzae]KAA5540854.1 dihydrodipicolinate synthase family protein [Adhaeribacter rhizoryzae]
MERKKGFIPVMLTPFQENGKIDYRGLTELTQFYLEAGASGLFANCLSSEMFELTPSERLQIIKHVLEVTNGTVPVVATGTFGGPIAGQADFVKKVHDLGVQAVICITGLLAEETESEEIFAQNAFHLFDLTPNIPLGFYECPVPYKRVISPQTLKQFVSAGRIIYHKDTCLDIDQVREKLRLADNPCFGLYDAYMVHAVESLKAGSAGLSCIQGNYFPELVVWLCENYNNTSLTEEVDRVQQFFIDNMDVMHAVYPIVSKYYLQKRGLNISTFTRREVGVFTPKIRKEVDELYQKYSRLQEELGLKVEI